MEKLSTVVPQWQKEIRGHGAQQKLTEEGDGIFCLGNGVIAIQPALLIKMGLEGS